MRKYFTTWDYRKNSIIFSLEISLLDEKLQHNDNWWHAAFPLEIYDNFNLITHYWYN